MQSEKVHFTREKETLLFTLYGKAMHSRSKDPILPDRWAEDAVSRIVGLTDILGQDVAIGAVERWRQEEGQATIRAPQLDLSRVRCLTVGKAKIDTSFGWS